MQRCCLQLSCNKSVFYGNIIFLLSLSVFLHFISPGELRNYLGGVRRVQQHSQSPHLAINRLTLYLTAYGGYHEWDKSAGRFH